MRPRARRGRARDAGADPTVEQIREIRRALLRRAGGTVEGYMRLMEELSRERATPGGRRVTSGRGARGKAA